MLFGLTQTLINHRKWEVFKRANTSKQIFTNKKQTKRLKTMHRLNSKKNALENDELEFDQKTAVEKKGFSLNFILGFFVFLYKTAIKP